MVGDKDIEVILLLLRSRMIRVTADALTKLNDEAYDRQSIAEEMIIDLTALIATLS